MAFKIITVGWQCREWMERTLQSVEDQSRHNWQIAIVYDPSDDDGADFIEKWCKDRDERWNYQINTDRHYAVRNQVDALSMLKPEDDDIVVFLDLDGDMLAHKDVLSRLNDYYDDDTLVTYGSYEPVPSGPVMPIERYPNLIETANEYRRFTARSGCRFNHLRTMRGCVANSIPLSQFTWSEGELKGQFYERGTDYVFMLTALELSGGKYKVIPETMCLYNHANPLADNVRYPAGNGDACLDDFLSRPPLNALASDYLPRIYQSRTYPDFTLEAGERREVLRDYAERYQLRFFVETGTNTGDTPWALQGTFERLYTIELDYALWAKAEERFSRIPNVECVFGDSAEVLPKVLKRLHSPALIWLDGHYSGAGTAHGQSSTPIREELQTLFAETLRHVILIDDARIFRDGPEHQMEDHYQDYPSLRWVKELADNYGYDFVLEDDIIRLTPRA